MNIFIYVVLAFSVFIFMSSLARSINSKVEMEERKHNLLVSIILFLGIMLTVSMKYRGLL